jgi:hypothetical protein
MVLKQDFQNFAIIALLLFRFYRHREKDDLVSKLLTLYICRKFGKIRNPLSNKQCSKFSSNPNQPLSP